MEREEPTIEELINKIEFLKQALLFYSNEENYNNNLITQDHGHQAKFALSQIVKIDKYNQKMIEDSYLGIENLKQEEILNNEDITYEESKIREINNLMKEINKN
jgi:hypothetical protein